MPRRTRLHLRPNHLRHLPLYRRRQQRIRLAHEIDTRYMPPPAITDTLVVPACRGLEGEVGEVGGGEGGGDIVEEGFERGAGVHVGALGWVELAFM